MQQEPFIKNQIQCLAMQLSAKLHTKPRENHLDKDTRKLIMVESQIYLNDYNKQKVQPKDLI